MWQGVSRRLSGLGRGGRTRFGLYSGRRTHHPCCAQGRDIRRGRWVDAGDGGGPLRLDCAANQPTASRLEVAAQEDLGNPKDCVSNGSGRPRRRGEDGLLPDRCQELQHHQRHPRPPPPAIGPVVLTTIGTRGRVPVVLCVLLRHHGRCLLRLGFLRRARRRSRAGRRPRPRCPSENPRPWGEQVAP